MTGGYYDGRPPEELIAIAEERLRQRGVKDTYSPTFITILPDGSIAFDFSGHIRALGLDLLASASATPPTDRQVRFLRESDNQSLAKIYDYLSGPDHWLYLEADTNAADVVKEVSSVLRSFVVTGGAENVQAELRAVGSKFAGVSGQARIEAALVGTTVAGGALPIVPSQQLLTFLDENGKSGLLKARPVFNAEYSGTQLAIPLFFWWDNVPIPVDGDYLVCASCTAWSNTANTAEALSLLSAAGAVTEVVNACQLFCTPAATHSMFAPFMGIVSLTKGTNQWRLQHVNASGRLDGNDHARLSIFGPIA